MDSSLENFIENISGDQYLRVQDDLGYGFVRLRAAEAQRRQAKQDIRSTEDVIIELLRNARDAHARAIFIATWTEGQKRHITILDDGDGIPLSMHDVVFEPFITSKLDSFRDDKWGVHGRGMALYSIRQNTVDARIVASEPGLGSVFSIESDTTLLSEKRDQSSIPRIVKDDKGKSVLRGPHNITRTVLEFAIEERSRISVYMGSCASIVATLYNLGANAASQLATVLESYDSTTPYIQRFAYALDVESLTDLACEFGFPISTRTAHRILNGEIKPLSLHLEVLLNQKGCCSTSTHATKTHGSHTSSLVSSMNGSEEINSEGQFLTRVNDKNNGTFLSQSQRSIKFSKQDIATFSRDVSKSFSSLAQAYYLDDSVEPIIQSKSNELIIKIPLITSNTDR